VSKPKILVVDDDLPMRKMAVKILESAYDVHTAASGQEALALLHGDFSPRLILLDIDMPQMDGFAVLARLSERPETARIPVIFLTAMTDAQNELQGFALGAKDFVRKPFHRDILCARIKAHIGDEREPGDRNVLDEHKLAALAEPLTNVELKVAQLIAKGLTNKEIMEQLYYSEPYVKKLVMRIFTKLHIDRRTKIVEYFK
jgi:putative two-component system response regulator